MEALKLPLRSRGRSRGPAGPGLSFLTGFGMAAVGVGAARALTTSFLPVLLERAERSPELIGVLMLVNPLAGFAIPLLVGLWSDRRPAGRLGHRLPFIIGGSLLTGGGLVAIGLGTGTSYLVLVLAGAATYIGLNATATAHRAIIVDGFEDKGRPAATSAQELAMIVGSLLGVVAGGAFVEPSAPVLFAGAALVVPLLAVPTVVAVKRRAKVRAPVQAEARRADLRALAAILRQPGPRDVLVAQILWVTAYAALPVFFVLYAREVLGLGAGIASLALAAIGLATGAGMLLAARASQSTSIRCSSWAPPCWVGACWQRRPSTRLRPWPPPSPSPPSGSVS